MRDESEMAPKEDFVLHCRGEVTLRRGHADLTPRAKKGRALLAILAAEGGPLSRVRIVDLLWSDRQDEQARASLRTLLAEMRHQYGADFDDLLHVERERIALALGVRSDLADACPEAAANGRERFGGLDHLDPELDDWLRMERARAADPAPALAPPDRDAPPRRDSRPMLIAALVLAGVAAIAAAMFPSRRPAAAGAMTVAVLPPADPALPSGLAVARLLDRLAADPAVRLIGSDSARLLGASGAPPRDWGRSLGIDRVVRLTTRSAAHGERLDVDVIDALSGARLWSQSVELDAQPTPALDAQLDRLLVEIGDGLALPGPSHRPPAPADLATAARLEEARRLIDRNDPAAALRARALLLPLARARPEPAVAAALAEATMAASDHVYAGGSIPLGQARLEAAALARQAIRAAPRSALGYAALGSSGMETAEAIPAFAKAVELQPGNALYRLRLARALEFDDRYVEAYRHAQQAARLDPLSPHPLIGLIRAANQLDRHDDIQRAIARFATQTPAPPPVAVGYVRAYYAFLRDDNADCVRQFGGRSAVAAARNDLRLRNVLLFCLTAIGDFAGARRLVEDENSLRADVLRADVAAVERRLAAMGQSFFSRHYDSLAAAELLVRSGRGKALVAAYDRGFTDSRQFLDQGGFLTLYPQPLIAAFRAAGREREVAALRGQLAKVAASATAREGGDEWENFNGASVALIDGRRDQAVALLERCYPTCFYAVLQRDIGEVALFRDLNDHPRFTALLGRYRQMVARQRRELGLA